MSHSTLFCDLAINERFYFADIRAAREVFNRNYGPFTKISETNYRTACGAESPVDCLAYMVRLESQYRFQIGQRIKTITSHFGTPSRRSRIEAYRTTSAGAEGYILADGGFFSVDELVSDEWQVTA